MQAELDGQVRFDEQAQPARTDQPRIGGDRQHPCVVAVQTNMVAADLTRAGCDQVGQRPRTERKQLLVVVLLVVWILADSACPPFALARLVLERQAAAADNQGGVRADLVAQPLHAG